MKKFMFILAIISYALFAHASVNINNPSIKKDSIGVNKKLNDLNSKLADLNAQLTNIQNQLPVDSAKYQDLLANSLDAQNKSKDAAKTRLAEM